MTIQEENPEQNETDRDSHPTGIETKLTPLDRKILNYIKKEGWIHSPHSVASSLELNPGSVRKRMSKLHKDGILQRPFHGYYSLDARALVS